jgi:hypothetical protein
MTRPLTRTFLALLALITQVSCNSASNADAETLHAKPPSDSDIPQLVSVAEGSDIAGVFVVDTRIPQES